MASMTFATCNSLSTGISPRFLAPPVCRKSRVSTYLSTTTDKSLTFLGTPSSKLFYSSSVQSGFTAKVERRILASASRNEGSSEPEAAQSDDANQARGQSTFPERFRYLTKEAPDRPVRWPWAIVVLAVAEAAVPDSVNSQMPLLTFAAFIGFGAVKSFIPEPLFWMCLCGLFCYSRFITKKDDVSTLLPSAAVLAAVGEPWVRFLVIGFYLALAIIQHSKATKEPSSEEVPETSRRLPIPLLLAALSVGVHLAAKWVRYRHLTWMIA
ncbi:uncharacterized protein LOC122000870 [Zingiber officinale]|uniref:Uncharacterized protein n=1 Tax=Zingiber officinale TaxID=94328 RepID=A0A8J5KW43_ZINOF|nr:uncharacterized protein LOC122000870 [Zingiber officinale]KAG6491824.1 hypothetical protein ZIOFF_046762 [Zingiber officinale]